MLVPIAPDSSTSCISLRDAAIDWATTPKELDEETDSPTHGQQISVYRRARIRSPSSWRDNVRIKDGQKPTVFTVGVVPCSELNRIEDECGGSGPNTVRSTELGWRCFLHGLRGIDGFGVTPKMHSVDGVEYVEPAWLAATFIGPLRAVGVEIGSIVWTWQSLMGGDVKN